MTELEELLRVGKITDRDKCCVCGKVLFIDGERQTDLCYHLGLSSKRVLRDGSYADNSKCSVLICQSCFNRDNNQVVMGAIWKRYKE